MRSKCSACTANSGLLTALLVHLSPQSNSIQVTLWWRRLVVAEVPEKKMDCQATALLASRPELVPLVKWVATGKAAIGAAPAGMQGAGGRCRRWRWPRCSSFQLFQFPSVRSFPNLQGRQRTAPPSLPPHSTNASASRYGSSLDVRFWSGCVGNKPFAINAFSKCCLHCLRCRPLS